MPTDKGEDTRPSGETFVRWYEHFYDQTEQMRARAEESHDFYHNIQWDEAEASKVRRRGQPANVYNEIKPQIDFLVGMEKQQRTDPRAFPRTPFHETDAQAATDAMRYVSSREDYDEHRSRVWFDILTVGWGGMELIPVQKPNGEIDLEITRNSWDRMWWDPHSAELDFSDASYRGLVRWMDFDDAIATYGEGARDRLEGAKKQRVGDALDTHADRPNDKHSWYDSGRNRVKICSIYYERGGVWYYAEFTGGQDGVLVHNVSSVLGDDGRPTHPFEWRSAYVDRKNNRFGLVDEMKDRQREINKRHSKLMHLLNSERTFGKRNAVADRGAFKAEAQKPDGHMEITENATWGVDVGIVSTDSEVVGHANLLGEAKEGIRRIGASQALTGKGNQEQSGRALQVQQQSGIVEIGALLDRMRHMDKFMYRRIWLGIRQFWQGPKWIRVTDDPRNLRFVALNAPPGLEGQVPPNAILSTTPVSEVDADIIIEDAPDMTTLLPEQFATLAELAKVGIIFPPQVYIKAAPSLRDRDQILDIVEQMQGQGPSPAEQVQLEQEMAKTDKIKSEARLTDVQAAEKFAEAQTPGVNTIQ